MDAKTVASIKCDRCGATIGLYTHPNGWRCPECIWNEREQLLESANALLNDADYSGKVVRVSRDNVDALRKAVRGVR